MARVYNLNATGMPERKQFPIDGLVEPGGRIVSFIDAAQPGPGLKQSELPHACLAGREVAVEPFGLMLYHADITI